MFVIERKIMNLCLVHNSGAYDTSISNMATRTTTKTTTATPTCQTCSESAVGLLLRTVRRISLLRVCECLCLSVWACVCLTNRHTNARHGNRNQTHSQFPYGKPKSALVRPLYAFHSIDTHTSTHAHHLYVCVEYDLLPDWVDNAKTE